MIDAAREAMEPVGEARGWRAALPPAQWLPALPAAVAEERRDRGRHPRRLRHPGVARLRLARRPASAVRHLRLPGGGLAYALFGSSAPACDRPHLRDLDARRRHGRGNGRGRSGPLGRHRGPDRAGHRRHVPAGLAAAPVLARQLHQRDHPARLQGRRGVDDRDDAAAQALRRQGRGEGFFERIGILWAPAPGYEPRGAGVRARRARRAPAGGEFLPGSRSRCSWWRPPSWCCR